MNSHPRQVGGAATVGSETTWVAVILPVQHSLQPPWYYNYGQG